jgi:hypothetical protein
MMVLHFLVLPQLEWILFLATLSLGFLLRHLESSLMNLETLPWGSLLCSDLLNFDFEDELA